MGYSHGGAPDKLEYGSYLTAFVVPDDAAAGFGGIDVVRHGRSGWDMPGRQFRRAFQRHDALLERSSPAATRTSAETLHRLGEPLQNAAAWWCS